MSKGTDKLTTLENQVEALEERMRVLEAAVFRICTKCRKRIDPNDPWTFGHDGRPLHTLDCMLEIRGG